MTPAPFILFIPSYGRGGSGEFVRSVTLAQAVARRWPGVRIEFLLPGGPGTRQDAPFPSVCHDGEEESKGAFDREQLERLKPDIAVFDSGCRSATLRLCRRLGIRTAYISDREGTCRKAFRLDWLRVLDRHWHQREHLTAPAFTRGQRLRALLSPTERLVFDTYLAEDDDPAGTALPEPVRVRLREPFLLFAPGGGGYRVDGRPVSELFVDAATRIAAEVGRASLVLLGPLYEGAAHGSDRVTVIRQVSAAQFVTLMRRAQIVITNGGHSLNQALACQALCVAAPLGGGDQPGRIAAYAAAGLIRAAQPSVESLVHETRALLDAETAAAQRERLARLAPVNGLPVMCEALGHLLQLRPRSA